MKKLRCKDWENNQHYKKKNKNFSVEQPWFMFWGRRLLVDRKFMSLSPEERDFLVVGCWALGSQDNGFLPSAEDIAFKLRVRDTEELSGIQKVNNLLDFLFEEGWLETYSEEVYAEMMDIVYEQIEEQKKSEQIVKETDYKKQVSDMGLSHLLKDAHPRNPPMVEKRR